MSDNFEFDVDSFRENMQEEMENDSKQNLGGGGNGASYLALGDIPLLDIVPDREYFGDVLPFIVTSTTYPDYAELKAKYGDKPMLAYKMNVWIHKNQGINKRDKVVCLKKTYGLPCPVCENLSAAYDGKKNAEDPREIQYFEKEISNNRYTLRTILFFVDKLDGNKVKVIDYPYNWFFNNLVKKAKRARGEREVIIPDFTDRGHSIRFFADESSMVDAQGNKIKKKDGSPVAGEIKDIEFIPRKPGEGYDPSILQQIPGLDTLLIVKTAEELRANMAPAQPTIQAMDLPTQPSVAIAPQISTGGVVAGGSGNITIGQGVTAGSVNLGNIGNTTPPSTAEEARKARINAMAGSSKAPEPVCPKGHVFGTEAYLFDECTSCDLNAKCYEVYSAS